MAKSLKQLAWAAVLAGRSADYFEHIEGGGTGSLDEFFLGWSKGAGSGLVSAWEGASDDTIAAKSAAPLVAGDVHTVLDAFVVAAGDRLQKKSPELTRAGAVDAFLKTPDGVLFYEIGKAIGQGSHFERHPKQLKRGLAVVREAVLRGADFDSHPVSLKFSALLQAGAK